MTKQTLPHFKRHLAAVGAFCVAALAFHTVHAQSIWVGDTDQDWNNADNWSDDTLPAGMIGEAESNVIVNIDAGNFPIIDTNSFFFPNDLIVGNGDGNGRLDHRAGILDVHNWSFLGNDGSEAIYNLADTSNTGGTLTGFGQGSGSFTSRENGNFFLGGNSGDTGTGTVNMNTTGSFNVGSLRIGTNVDRTGTFNLDSGSVNAIDVELGRGDTNAHTSTGVLNISGGTINTVERFRLGFAGATGNTAVVNNDGGTINVNTAAEGGGNMELGEWDATTNTVNQTSGEIGIQNNASIVFGVAGHAGESTFNHDGGTVTFYSDGGSTVGGTGSVILGNSIGDANWQNSSGTHTYNLNGGTLTTPSVSRTSDNPDGEPEGSGTFNFNGGTVAAAGDNDTFMEGITAANVQAGGAVIDTNGFEITIGQSLVDGGGDGGLTKLGAGTLTLSGANTYTGPTNVDEGTLLIEGSLSDSLVNVASGAVFGGSGEFAGDLHFDLGASFYFNPFDTLVVGGEVTFDGFGIEDLVGLDDMVDPATYALIDGNVIFDNISNVGAENAVDLGNGVSAYFQAGSLDLVVVPEPSTYALIFGALALAGVVGRRRLRKA